MGCAAARTGWERQQHRVMRWFRITSLGQWLTGWAAVALTAHAAEPWTLARALDQALAHNPDARVAVQRIAAAQAGLEQANSAVWPKLQFQSSYTRTDNPMFSFGNILNQQAFSPSINFNQVPDTDDLNVKGLVTVPLYAGGQISAGRTAAKANTEVARQNAEAVRNALAFEVARVFHTVLKTREFIRAAESVVKDYETNLAIANHRFQAGTLLRADVLDVEVRLAQAREDLVRARNANELARSALRNLLGLDPGDFDVADAAPAVAVPATDGPSHRAELVASHQRMLAAEAGVRQSKGGYQPSLSAFGSLDYDYGWRTQGDGESYTAGVLLQWNLWDGKLTRGKVHAARADLETAREEDRKLRLGLELEAEQARLNLKDASERLEVTAKSVALAAESADLTRARFEQGLAIPTQLIDAETALTAARVRRAEAETDQRIAVAALRKALGLPQLDAK